MYHSWPVLCRGLQPKDCAKRLCRVFRFLWVAVLRQSLCKSEHDMTKYFNQRIASHRVLFKDQFNKYFKTHVMLIIQYRNLFPNGQLLSDDLRPSIMKLADNLKVINYLFLCYLLQYRSKPFVEKSAGGKAVVLQ